MLKIFVLITLLGLTVICQTVPRKGDANLTRTQQNQTFFNPKDRATKAAEVDALLAEYIKPGTPSPGVAVLVIQEDKIMYRAFKGLAKGALPGETQTPIGPETLFDLASVSKQFTAMAIVLLHAQGKLNFEDKLSKFFPAPSGPFHDIKFKPEVETQVTVRQLLNHTSGLANVVKLFRDGSSECPPVHIHYPRPAQAFHESGIDFQPTAIDALKCLSSQPLRFTPGTKWEYSNSGYIVLAQIVERVTGQRFRDFVRDNIFRPLRMNNSFVADEETPVIANRATSYDRGWSQFHDIDYTPFNKIYGDGNVNTTLDDMGKWEHALRIIFNQTSGPAETPLVNEQVIEEAFGAKDTTNINSRVQYSTGWFFGHFRDIPLMWHSGSWVGFRTMILRIIPNPHFTVIVLANNMHIPASILACRIAKIYLRELLSLPASIGPDLQQLKRVVDNYHMTADQDPYSDDITLEGSNLWVKGWDLEKFKLVFNQEQTNQTIDGSLVFYLENLEGFDQFRYDIKDSKLIPPPKTRDDKFNPATQRF